ncbi:MAG: hypothetical protein O9262_12160, partial [Cyclobacteriaceae bacterium]|nr:hypothetical protein [Cyclobacteriaceae bacterium]
NNLYAFNVVTGELSTLSANFAEEESVTHLFATPTRLYASGFFVNVNDQERAAGLASFDLTSGLLNDWNPNLGGAWGSIFGDADRIYVYGDFSIVDGVNRAGLAAFNSSSGSILDWAPQDHLFVTAITANETDVYVSGRSADGTTNTIFAYNKNSGMTSFPAIEYSGGDGANAVRTMAATANHLYVGGDFNTLTRGTNNFNRLYFASINTASGQVEDLTIEVGPDPISFGNAFVSALAVTDGTVYLGGYFNGINGAPRHSLAALSTETGELTDWKFSSVNLVSDVVTGRSIRNLTVFEDGVFVGGQFDVINNFFRISNFLRASPDRSNVVTGTVFYDNNQNGVQDAGEDGVPNLLMELQPGNIFYPTDANGNYTVYTGIGNYTLRPVHPTYAINVTPNERQLSFVDDLQTSANNNFAIAIIPSITDMGITLTTDQNLRPGFYFNYAVTFTNHGTVPS